MRYIASITFTSARGHQGRRAFLIDTKLDGNAITYAYRAGIALVSRVGGHGVHVVELQKLEELHPATEC